MSIAIILCLITLLTLTVLPGCGGTKIIIPKTISELSLVETWNKVAKMIHIQKDAVELEYFRLLTDQDRKIDGLSFIFREDNTNGRPKTYSVEINSKGELDWHSYQSIAPDKTLHPSVVFTEIDKFDLSSIKPGDAGLELRAEFQNSDADYSNDNLNIYELDNGALLPLKKVDFTLIPFCIISVYPLTNNTPDLNARSSSQIWFLSQDTAKAASIEYAAIQ
jgi:hypothetical protein